MMSEDADLISFEDLARLLVDRLAPILPGGVEVFSEGSLAGVTTPDGHSSALDLSTGVDSITPAAIAMRAEYFLDRMQDCAIEALHHGWPASTSDRPGAELPLACADLDGQRLTLGYARGDVRTELAPIELCPGRSTGP